MKYALIQSGQIVRTQWFDGAPPVLAPAKGVVWLELVETAQPVFDPLTHTLAELAPLISATQCTRQWALVALPPEVVAANQAAQAQQAADDAVRNTAKLDPTIQYLLTHTAAEIEAKVQADVGSLAAAKTFIAKLAVAVGVLARRELRE